jgi:hypothetical protein
MLRSPALPLSLLFAAAVAVAPARADEPPPPESSEPAAPAAKAPASAERPNLKPSDPIPTDDERVLYALGVRGRYLSVPGFLLSPWLQNFQELNSGSVGVEFTRRKGTLDIVFSLDFGWYTPGGGGTNWLANPPDHTAMLDTHYTEFHNLSFLSADVGFFWNKDLTKWLGFTIGGGVGIGVVLGDIWIINSSTACTPGNVSNTDLCHPYSQQLDPQTGQVIGDIRPGDPNFQQKLDATARLQAACIAGGGSADQCKDTADHPYWHTWTKIPVLPVVNFIIGFKFKVHRHLNINLNGGLRNGFVVGAGPEYVF